MSCAPTAQRSAGSSSAARSLVNRPSGSPDGNSIAFGLSDEEDYDSGGSIVVIPSTGGGVRYVTDGQITDGSADPAAKTDDSEPDWSPDGARLAFTRLVWLCHSCDQEEVFSVAADVPMSAGSPPTRAMKLIGRRGRQAVLESLPRHPKELRLSRPRANACASSTGSGHSEFGSH